ncbi:hypothetical protein JHU04_002485 [Brenneria sp. 4F2]|nr:hypothetical protein [Brenneria bubanii]
MSIRNSIIEFMKDKELVTFNEIYSFCQQRGSSYPGVYGEVRSMCSAGLLLRSGEAGGYRREGYRYRLLIESSKYPPMNIDTSQHNPLITFFDRRLRGVRAS